MSVICFVALHVSRIYRGIDFTLVLKMRTLVFLEMYLFLQLGYNWINVQFAFFIQF
jgi:hypothetical protein